MVKRISSLRARMTPRESRDRIGCLPLLIAGVLILAGVSIALSYVMRSVPVEDNLVIAPGVDPVLVEDLAHAKAMAQAWTTSGEILEMQVMEQMQQIGQYVDAATMPTGGQDGPIEDEAVAHGAAPVKSDDLFYGISL